MTDETYVQQRITAERAATGRYVPPESILTPERLAAAVAYLESLPEERFHAAMDRAWEQLTGRPVPRYLPPLRTGRLMS